MSDNEIAVVGMAGRFPGARDVRQYWRNLRDGIESIRRYGESELLEAGVSPEHLGDPRYVRAGAPLEGMADFDAEFFGFSPRDAAIMDPQHRHFLEVAWEALEDAAHPPEAFEGPIGVFAGCGMNAYMMFNLLTNPGLMDSVGLFLIRHTGNDKDFLTTRVSYCLDLRGPSVSVQTACSTSLVAIHQAAQSLLSGECDMALAGGVTIEQPHGRGYLYQEGEILSPDGHCRAFDRASQGTVFGSGAGVVVLRRLADALADRDHIYAVLKGSAINNDGSTKMGYLAPSVDGQAEAIAEAIAISGVEADSIQYVEAHGTGTPVGDPIEIAALTRAFRATSDAVGTCRVGSVKTNIGHLDTAAGVASFIKVCSAIEHREMPPSLHFDEPNPAIELADSPFLVNEALRDWPASRRPRRAGVSSLGVGGTNAHVILEQAPDAPPGVGGRPFQILTVSGRNPRALEENAERLARTLGESPDLELADVAYTLHVGRRAFAHRRSVVCRDLREAQAGLTATPGGSVAVGNAHERPSAVFLFPGGGAQYPRMAKGIYDREPVFREQVDRGLAWLRENEGVDLRPWLFPSEEATSDAAAAMLRPSLQLPALFIVEFALAELWKSWGVEPSALLGHSMGENTAACVAGVFSYEDALGLVRLRGRLFEQVAGGGMLSVAMPAEELSALLDGPLSGQGLALGAVNAPGLCVASGPTGAIESLKRELASRDVPFHRVSIDVAAHSAMLDPILTAFGAYLRRIPLSTPRVPFLSNHSGTWIRDDEATDPDYWVRHLRGTVCFADNVETLVAEPGRVLIEVGPGRTLASLVRQGRGATPNAVVSSLRHAEEDVDDVAFVLRALGEVWSAGLSIDWARFHEKETRRRLSLPGYAFQRQRYWIEPGAAAEVVGETTTSSALERIADTEDWYFEPVWRRVPVPVPEETPEGGRDAHRWLILLDTAGVGSQIAERLRDQGDEVFTVREADAYYRVGEWEYALAPEEGRSGYDQLFQDLAARDWMPDRIIHLWLLTVDQQARPGSSFYHHILERGFYSLLFIAQAFGDDPPRSPVHLSVVSNGAMEVASEGLPYPLKATVLGPCKVIPQEYPGLTCANIDVVLPELTSRFSRRQALRRRGAVAEELMEELRARPESTVVAYRSGERWQQQIEPFRPTPLPGTTSLLRDEGVYLVTGGLGGIGLALAEHLVRTHRARLVLVGRTALPERDAWLDWIDRHPASDPVAATLLRLRALEEAGAQVLPLSADVANHEQMKQVLCQARERFDEIHGVFHAAGVLDDGLIQLKTQEDIEAVFAPKIQGTLVLDELFSQAPLDFLVLFSSTSSLLGAAGQVDYVAANGFLDAFAHSRSRGPRLVKTVNWGVWADVGMAAAAASRAEGATPAQLAAHPWLDERRQLSAERWELASELDTTRDWILDEHRTRAGQAVLPGTAYLELALAARREVGLDGPAELQDWLFFAPLGARDGEPLTVRVQLEGPDAERVRIESRPGPLSQQSGSWTLHAEGRIVALGGDAPDPLPIEALKRRCDEDESPYDPDGAKTDQEAHLAFGTRWRCLRQVQWGKAEAVALLELPEAVRDEGAAIELHPALLDVASGFAIRLIEGYAPEDGLYVPLSYRRVRVHGALGARTHSHVRCHADPRSGRDTASFDVTLCDADGVVKVEIEQLTIKRLPGGHAFGASPAWSGPPDLSHLSPAEQAFRRSLAAGIQIDEGAQALERILAAEHVPQVIVSSIALAELMKPLEAAASAGPDGPARFRRPDLDNDYVAPRDEIERELVGMFEELLGVDRVGVDDDFFHLGGHSLIAVRLFVRIRQRFEVDYPISVLFDAPTVARCAELVREAIGAAASSGTAGDEGFRFLVPMHRTLDRSRTPFFLVAGMFGNVLNLRHLAGLIGSERPFYSIQARGLRGDERPHDSFEEMARDYLAEVREVQPHGPYLIGGFSGGGITAYEMAQQLRAAGESVGALVFLDTPTVGAPELSRRERLQIHWERLLRGGIGYATSWLRRRIEWEIEKRSQEREPSSQPFEFRSREIEIGFRSALSRYHTREWDGVVHLFRPALDEAHVLGPGRVVNAEREFVFPDNGWSAFAHGGVAVEEVPGDHDSMVLEPNVRVLAVELRRVLDEADGD